ncbi:MAG: thioesterase family protein [Pseudomonadota bacterium]
MSAFSQEITVNWGESDPFGLVYYPRELAWFNDVEHELLRRIGYPTDRMIRDNRTAFVMGEVHFSFTGPAAYGDRVRCRIAMTEMRERTIEWHCTAINLRTSDQITDGKAIRVHAQIQEDGNLKSVPIPDELRTALREFKE